LPARTPEASNRLLGIISILMEQVIALGLRDENPCVGVKKLKHKAAVSPLDRGVEK